MAELNAGHCSRNLRVCAFPMCGTKTIDCHCYAGATFFMAVSAFHLLSVHHCIIPHHLDPIGALNKNKEMSKK